MATIADKYVKKLEYLKACVKSSHSYWKENADRYNYFMNFVFASNLSNDDITKLNALKKPTIEFNVTEAFISRLRGELAEHEPELQVGIADGVLDEDVTDVDIKTIQVIDGNIRETLYGSDNDNVQYHTYSESLGGGYSVLRTDTDYLNEMSFEQKIFVEKVFNPTLTGFDPLARKPHKGDGLYCFELIPKTKEDIEAEFGADIANKLQYTKSLGGFNWSYENEGTKIALICDFYLKVPKRVKIVKLTNGKTVRKDHYNKMREMWEDLNIIELFPEIVHERWSTITAIERYIFCESGVLKQEQTIFKYLPLIFVDGNSVVLPMRKSRTCKPMTRPYAYQVAGIQKLKNLAGQTIGHEINTMVMHKWKVAIESIPEKYEKAYTDIQNASSLVYHAFYDKDPTKPLPPPMEIQRTPMPPIVEQIFFGADRVIQSILGSYDAQMGITNGDTSGKAIMQGAMHSSAASKPYLVSLTAAFSRCAQIILDLIPKIYVTPRSIPVLLPNGIREHKIINKEEVQESVMLQYDPDNLRVKIEVGVNTALQKQITQDQIIRMMAASEAFAKFMNSMGLVTMIDNMSIRGLEELKKKAIDFMQMERQAAEAASQQVPIEKQLIDAEVKVETDKTEQRREEAEGNLAIRSAQVAVDNKKATIEFMKLLALVKKEELQSAINAEKMDAESASEAIKLAIDINNKQMDLERANKDAADKSRAAAQKAAEQAKKNTVPLA
jgi:hypothetical protein